MLSTTRQTKQTPTCDLKQNLVDFRTRSTEQRHLKFRHHRNILHSLESSSAGENYRQSFASANILAPFWDWTFGLQNHQVPNICQALNSFYAATLEALQSPEEVQYQS